MFRTDSKTGGVQRGAGLLSPASESTGSLQGIRHDHASRSTRPRWGLRPANPSRRRPAPGRHLGLRIRPGIASFGHRTPPSPIHPHGLPAVARPGADARGRGVHGRHCEEVLEAGLRLILKVARSGPESGSRCADDCSSDHFPLRRASDASVTRFGRRGGDPVLARGATDGNRSRRNQPTRHHRLPQRGEREFQDRHRARSSPAPVAGGGVAPLHLLGDGSHAARRSTPHRRIPSRTASQARTIVHAATGFISESPGPTGVAS